MNKAQRLVAAVTSLAVLLGNAGCATTYNFSPLLSARQQQPGDGAVPTAPDSSRTALAGNLHLAQAALMDQRRLLWQDAGMTEQIKNATALGLIGLGSVAAYRGLQGESSSGWLKRAGLLASATYLGADFLQPSARQRVNLAGATSLTCLALTVAAYEMPLEDYNKIKENVAMARAGLEQLASTLRLLGRYEYHSDTWWLVRGGWNKLRWATKALNSADNALGNIEQSGPRLHNLTSTLAGEVALQISRVTKDLSDIPDAIAKLKPNANLLLGSEVFPPLAKDSEDADPPKGGSEGTGTSLDAKGKSGAATDAQCGVSAKAATPDSAPEIAGDAKKAALDAEASAKRAARSADRAASSAATAVNAARRIAASASAAKSDQQPDEGQESALRTALDKATQHLDKHLGPVVSFVHRVAAARKSALDLPPACGASGVDLVPSHRAIVLQAGEGFQYLLQGDSGRAGVSVLGDLLPRDVLDLSMPLTQASTVVRLQAGKRVPAVVNTVVRISDSKGQQTFDITVKICPGVV